MEQIADGIYVETGYQGVNVGAVVTPRGVVCIDTPSYPRDARHWLVQLHRLTHHPLKYLILTDCHGDRIINTRWFNAPIVMHRAAAAQLRTYERRYPQSLLDSLIERNPTHGRALTPHPVTHPAFSFTDKLQIRLGDRILMLLHAPGPTPGNLWLYLPKERLLFTGDGVISETHPRLTETNGRQWLETLALLEDSALEVDEIVPGRGPSGDTQCARRVAAYIQEAQALALDRLQHGEPNGGLAVHVDHLLTRFPVADEPLEWTRRQIRLGLDHFYDELKLEKQATMAS